MNIQVSEDIKRLEGGSIDYNYYSSVGRRTRSREINAIWGKIPGLPASSLGIAPVLAVLIFVNLMVF